MFRCVLKRETRWCLKIIPLSFLVRKLFAKNGTFSNRYLFYFAPTWRGQDRVVGRGPGALDHAPLGRRRHPLRLFGALQSRMFYRENVGWRAPSNDEKFLRKVPPMTTVRRPPWVKWRPPSPCPPRDFPNTLLGQDLTGRGQPGYHWTQNVPSIRLVFVPQFYLNQGRN